MIEVIYSRYYCLYSEEFDTTKEALNFIERGSDDGYLYPIGIFKDSKPIIYNGYVNTYPPSDAQKEQMIRMYQEVKNHKGPGAPAVKWNEYPLTHPR